MLKISTFQGRPRSDNMDAQTGLDLLLACVYRVFSLHRALCLLSLLVILNWAASNEKAPHPGLCYSLKHSIVSNISVCGQQRH